MGSLDQFMAFGRVALVCGPLAAILLTGCAARRPSQPEGAAPAQQAIDPTVNRQRIHALWEARTREGVPVDFCLGPGDLLTVSVFRLPEMQAMRVRVSSTGSVSLPLIGEIQAAGRTQDELAAEIARQLRAGYMRNP
jgi:polysaccharide export outer membrane protein